MKKAKKTVSLFLAMVMILSIIVIAPTTASAANTNIFNVGSYNINTVVSYANSKVGTSYANGYCLAFVKQIFADTCGFTSTACCAYKYGNSFIDSTSKNNIPVGADVFFGGSNVICSCGSKAGHIGIYVGDGMVIHAWSGKVVKTSLDYIINCGYPYRGWGWHGNQSFYTPPTDTQPPTLLNIYQDNFSNSGYTLHFTLTDNTALSYVIIYTNINGNNRNSERINLSGTRQDVSYNVKYSDYGETTGYRHGIWAYDVQGNKCQSPWIEVVSDTEIPVISNIYQDNFTDDGYTIHFTVTDNNSLKYYKIFSWINGYAQKIEDINISGKVENVSYRVNYSDFNNEKSGYINAIWAYDTANNKGVSPFIYVETDNKAPDITDVYQDNFNEDGYTLHFTVTDTNWLKYVIVYTNVNGTNRKEERIDLSGKTQEVSYKVKYSDYGTKTGYRQGIWAYDVQGNKFQTPWIVIENNQEITTSTESTQPTTVMPTEPTEPTQSTTKSTETTESTEPTTKPTETTTTEPSEAPSQPTEDIFHVVAGSPELCNGVEWDPASPLNLMTLDDDGVYRITYSNVPAGKYFFKVTTNGAWDNGEFNLVGNAMYGGPNAEITVSEDNSTVEISFKQSDMHANAYINGVLVDVGATEPTTVNPTEPTEATQPTVKPTEPTTCNHSEVWTITTGSTYFTKGKRVTKCAHCGKVFNKTTLPKEVLQTPSFTVKTSKGSVTIKYKKVKDAKGFVVDCKIGKTTFTKTIKTTKSKAVKFTGLKKGTKVSVWIKAYTTSGSKKAYSYWSKKKVVWVK
ncbi:MAG: NlpC/P60 family protein [Ruminococcus sp.]